MTDDVTRTRVPDRLFTFMTGSQAYVDRTDWPEAYDLIHKLEAAPMRKDRSMHLPLTTDERSIVLHYALTLQSASRDDAGWEPDARGDLNSARSVVRRLESEGVSEA